MALEILLEVVLVLFDGFYGVSLLQCSYPVTHIWVLFGFFVVRVILLMPVLLSKLMMPDSASST